MSKELPTLYDNDKAAVLEQVVINGDLSKLSPADRVKYYKAVCESLGLNPLTKPFDYIQLNGKLTLYARRDAADQLRKIHGISVTITSREQVGDIYVVQAKAVDREGRTDEAIGAVSIAGLKGDALANAMMKAETKAKRRVTLSLAGLGWLDETEMETIPDAKPFNESEQYKPEPAKTEEKEDLATELQRKKIYAMANKLGYDKDTMHAMISERYGKESSKELTKNEASDLIEHLAELEKQMTVEVEAEVK